MPAPMELLATLTDTLGFTEAGGLVSSSENPQGQRGSVLDRVRRHIPEVSSVYFSEDDPLAYLATSQAFQNVELLRIQRKVWNDCRVPLLFAVDATHVRVYDAWSEPARDANRVDDDSRLIRLLDQTALDLGHLREFHRMSLDTGTFASEFRGRFDARNRCDTSLLNNLEETWRELISGSRGLPEDVAHRLLLRSILLLHLEHRRWLDAGTYGKYVKGARKLTDVYSDRDATYRLFERVAARFNGDLLPVDTAEIVVDERHLTRLRGFLDGTTDFPSGQRSFWPLYDFSVIPIQLISSVYERLLHKRDPSKARKTGAYFTPYPLVELVMNEVLPWPEATQKRGAALPRIADPACGSGVFLVEAFRRLVAYWRHEHSGQRPSCEALSDLLSGHIFGIDSDESGLAIKVAAFSLYLAMLDELDEGEPLTFPRLTQRRSGTCPNLINKCAFQAVESMPTFDLVVGNPPWRRAKLADHIRTYCTKHEHPVAEEIAQAFLWLAGDLVAPDGHVALLGPSKWLFNREGPDVEFREQFFARNQVDAVINLSALVSGDNRLFHANAPATAVVYRRRRSEPPSPSILYCVPRPVPQGATPMALVIDAGDVKWLPREEAESSPYIWKTMYVGSWRDYRLLQRLQTRKVTLAEFEEGQRKYGWRSGRGFQPDGTKNTKNDETAAVILSVPYVESDDLSPLVTCVDDSKRWTIDSFKRTGPKLIYRAPHVIFKRAIENHRIFATFCNVDCAFQDKIMAMHGPADHIDHVKALAAYLNSSLASYLLFLTATSWGIDRRWVDKGEILSLPSTPLAQQSTVRELAQLIDLLLHAEEASQREALDHRIDEAVFNAFGIYPAERLLIRDVLRTSIDFVHSRGQSAAVAPPSGDELEEYASAFISVFGPIAAGAKKRLEWMAYDGCGPLRVVSFHLKSGGLSQQSRASKTLDAVLGELSELLWRRDGVNVYRRRHLRIFEDNALHIVKPAELRFWTPSAAFHDADEALAQSLTETPDVAS
jgi:SAM-dependent methyltransferase